MSIANEPDFDGRHKSSELLVESTIGIKLEQENTDSINVLPTLSPIIDLSQSESHLQSKRCGCGCVPPNMLSLFEMAALRAKRRQEQQLLAKANQS